MDCGVLACVAADGLSSDFAECYGRRFGCKSMNPLERVMGPPMAAPESQGMRALRIGFIVSVSATGLGVVGLSSLVVLFGRAGAGAVLLGLMTLTAIAGVIFFFRKTRRDDQWIAARGFVNDGETP
jgi:hypothetical protein